MKLSGLTLLALCSLPSAFGLAQGLPPDSGLLITRVNSEQWRIRLIAGPTDQQFSGIVESNLPIKSVRGSPLASDSHTVL